MSNVDQNQATSFTPVYSYATLAYAEGFFAAKLSQMAFWATLTEAEQQAALNEATLHMDSMVYIGRKLVINQEREWPRYLENGSIGDIAYLESKIIPDVANACCEQAYFIAQSVKYGHDHQARQEHQAQGASSIARAGANESYDLTKARRHRLCRVAYEMLKPYLAKSGNLRDPFDISSGFIRGY